MGIVGTIPPGWRWIRWRKGVVIHCRVLIWAQGRVGDLLELASEIPVCQRGGSSGGHHRGGGDGGWVGVGHQQGAWCCEDSARTTRELYPMRHAVGGLVRMIASVDIWQSPEKGDEPMRKEVERERTE